MVQMKDFYLNNAHSIIKRDRIRCFWDRSRRREAQPRKMAAKMADKMAVKMAVNMAVN